MTIRTMRITGNVPLHYWERNICAGYGFISTISSTNLYTVTFDMDLACPHTTMRAPN